MYPTISASRSSSVLCVSLIFFTASILVLLKEYYDMRFTIRLIQSQQAFKQAVAARFDRHVDAVSAVPGPVMVIGHMTNKAARPG